MPIWRIYKKNQLEQVIGVRGSNDKDIPFRKLFDKYRSEILALEKQRKEKLGKK